MRHYPTFLSWTAMLRRCNDRRFSKFKRYGARGIRVCPEWISYDSFVSDVGLRPDGTTLDRIDNSGNYEPGNCRWADRKTQARNSSAAAEIRAFGETKSFAAWVEDPRCAVGYRTLVARITRGEDPENAISRPTRESFAAKCRETGAPYGRTRMRVLRGWSESEALATPLLHRARPTQNPERANV